MSNTALPIIRPGAERADVVGFRPSTSASSPYRSVPPGTGSASASGAIVSTVGAEVSDPDAAVVPDPAALVSCDSTADVSSVELLELEQAPAMKAKAVNTPTANARGRLLER